MLGEVVRLGMWCTVRRARDLHQGVARHGVARLSGAKSCETSVRGIVQAGVAQGRLVGAWPRQQAGVSAHSDVFGCLLVWSTMRPITRRLC